MILTWHVGGFVKIDWRQIIAPKLSTMFTGIIRAIGTVNSIASNGARLGIDLGGVAAAVGDSVAVNGACLTVQKLNHGCGEFALSQETLTRCLVGQWQVGARVNLEPALTLQTPLGGHLVAGHIDGIVEITAREDMNNFIRLEFIAPRELAKFLAIKGSVAIDGVALTINEIIDRENDARFAVMLVPHTLSATTLGELQAGSCAHLEVDLVARYVHRLTEIKS